jgi:hypothetical protein
MSVEAAQYLSGFCYFMAGFTACFAWMVWMEMKGLPQANATGEGGEGVKTNPNSDCG